jgi:uncharacterized protein YndB with AHSA1/START domain
VKFRVELETEIRRSAQEVFDYLANVENNPEWASEFAKVEKETDGDVGQGSVFRIWLKPPTSLKGVLTGNEEARSKRPPSETTLAWAEYEPPHRLVAQSPPLKRGAGTILTTQTFNVEEIAAGETRVRVSWDREVRDVPLERIAAPLIAKLIPREIRKAQTRSLQRLKAVLEGGDAETSG